MSLVENIRKRQKAGKSRSKANSTVSDKNYAEMERGWKNTKNERKESKAKREMA
tara:strand:- start:106 stop:267 length:162 start_codon:yes stop_codon:yes gene_type:complete